VPHNARDQRLRALFLVDFLAVDLRAVDFLRPVDLRLAVDFLAVFLAVDFLAVDFLAVDFRVDFRAEDFLAVRFRVAAAFLAAADLLAAVLFRVAAAFLAAVLRDVFLVVAIAHPLSPGQDAIRFRRRRSRSLMPPHTPYRSSRRSA